MAPGRASYDLADLAAHSHDHDHDHDHESDGG
jgi:hypothetical protein